MSIRKFLVQNYELSTHVRIFGKTIITLRAGRIIYPLFILIGVIIIGNPLTYTFFWYHIPAYIFLALTIYFGFIHFRLFPYTWEELDTEQRYFWMMAYNKAGGSGGMENIYPRSMDQWNAEFWILQEIIERNYYTGRFANLRSLTGLMASIIITIIWYFYWQ
jgi:hypothetical protein